MYSYSSLSYFANNLILFFTIFFFIIIDCYFHYSVTAHVIEFTPDFLYSALLFLLNGYHYSVSTHVIDFTPDFLYSALLFLLNG